MTASPEKVQTATAVLAKIRANDPHFAEPGDAMVLTWAEHLTIANVPRDVALEAVDRMYADVNTPAFRPLPGVLLMHCRAVTQHRVESVPSQRESKWKDMQLAIQRAGDAKSAPDNDDPPAHWTREQRQAAYWAKVGAMRDERDATERRP